MPKKPGETWRGHVSNKVKYTYNAKTYTPLTIRIKRDGSDGFVLDDLRRAAERDGMSLNAWVVALIADNL